MPTLLSAPLQRIQPLQLFTQQQPNMKASNSGRRPVDAWSRNWHLNSRSGTHMFTRCFDRISQLVLLFFISFLSLTATQTTDQRHIAPIDSESRYYYLGCYPGHFGIFQQAMYTRSPQTCAEICKYQRLPYAVLSAARCFCTNIINRRKRLNDRLCNTLCLADKSQTCGGAGVFSYYTGLLLVNKLHVENITENTVTIGWETPALSRNLTAEKITNFLIRTRVLHTYSTLSLFTQPEFIVQGTEKRFEITDLHPATEYNITLKAICKMDVCGSLSVLAITEVGVPSPSPPQPSVIGTTDSTMTIEIAPVRNDNGPVTKVLVIAEVIDASLSQTFDAELLGSWQKAQDDGLPYYIAAQLDYNSPTDNVKRTFVVGDGEKYGPYVNAPLNTTADDIHLSLGVISTLNNVTKILYTRASHDQHRVNLENFTYANFDAGRSSITALTVTCIVFAIFLALSVFTYFYLRYKIYKARGSINCSAHEMTMQQPIIERENNGFIVVDELLTTENFHQHMDALVSTLDATKRLPRNALRMNVDDVIADGQYGEVISGKFISATLPEVSVDCQLHVLALDDLHGEEQAQLLRDFRNLSKLQQHEHILDFYGISASNDWFYIVFEHQTVSLKRRLVESRRVPSSAPMQRITALSEQLVLQWIYELARALEYLNKCNVVHKQLCSHSIFITPDAKVKVSVFGPIPNINYQNKVDITRWLAPEALRYQHYSVKSDVWSFACVAWECCTLGATLYANITNTEQLLDAIKSGSRPVQPTFVFQDFYQLLLNCWQLEPSERIHFEEIAYNVRQLMTSPQHALCFDRAAEAPGCKVLDTLPYYIPMLEALN